MDEEYDFRKERKLKWLLQNGDFPLDIEDDEAEIETLKPFKNIDILKKDWSPTENKFMVEKRMVKDGKEHKYQSNKQKKFNSGTFSVPPTKKPKKSPQKDEMEKVQNKYHLLEILLIWIRKKLFKLFVW